MRNYWFWLVGVAALILYVVTLTDVHTYDAYSYAAAVQTKPAAETFHPHHLLYGPLGVGVYRLAQAFGYAGMALLPLQWLNALAGAVGVAMWAIVLHRIAHRWSLAMLGAVLLGAAFAWWRYAIEVEVYTFAALFLIIGIGLIIDVIDAPLNHRRWLWLGVVHAGAILFHQTNVLWGAVVLLAWWLAEWPAAASRRVRWRCLWSYLGLAIPLVLIPYLAVMVGWSGFRSWGEIRGWLFEYASTGFWGGAVSLSTVQKLLHGWSRTIAPIWGGWLGLSFVALIGWRWRWLWREWRAVTLVMLGWIAIYTLFFGWWEADNIEFWIAILPPVLLLVVVCLSVAPRWMHVGVALLGLALVISNGLHILRDGNRSRDEDRQIVTALAAQTAPGDLLVVPNGLQVLYLQVEFQRPNVVDLSAVPGDWDAACGLIRSMITETFGAGYHVWIDTSVLTPPPVLLQRYRLDLHAVEGCFAPFVGQLDRDQNPRYAVLQPSATLPPSWPWAEGWSWGWRLNNAESLGWDAGWTLRPATDPHLVSPPLALDAGEWRSLELTVATDIPGQEAQIYWIAPNQSATEERSIRWALEGDGQPHTYRFDLQAIGGWSGPIALLRLDPVSSGDGQGTVRLIHLELK